MNYLHTRTRRLVAAVLFLSAVGLAATLSVPALSANAHSAGGNTVSFYKKSTLLGSIPVANGQSLDIVWKTPACRNGYSSPPAAFTWSGGSTGVASAPIMGPCGHAPGAQFPNGANDFACRLYPFPIECWWTWKKSSGSASTSAKVSNPGGGTIGTVYLFGRTVLYAYVITPGQPPKKISVPAGADTVTFDAG